MSRKLSRRASTSERGVTEKDVPKVKDKLIEEEEAQIGSVSTQYCYVPVYLDFNQPWSWQELIIILFEWDVLYRGL